MPEEFSVTRSTLHRTFNRNAGQCRGGTGLWPNGNEATYNPEGTIKFAFDQQVGLMQVTNGMAPGFDWITNTGNGANIYQSSLTQASNYVANRRNTNPQLPNLTG